MALGLEECLYGKFGPEMHQVQDNLFPIISNFKQAFTLHTQFGKAAQRIEISSDVFCY